MGSRPKVTFCVHDTRKCRMLFIVQFIVSLFNQFFDSFVVLFTEARTGATANDSLYSRFRSSAVAKPQHELAAYTSFATTTDLKMMWTEAAVMSWVLSIRRAWTLCEHEEMT